MREPNNAIPDKDKHAESDNGPTKQEGNIESFTLIQQKEKPTTLCKMSYAWLGICANNQVNNGLFLQIPVVDSCRDLSPGFCRDLLLGDCKASVRQCQPQQLRHLSYQVPTKCKSQKCKGGCDG